MIQRIQSILLLLAAACMSFLYLPSFEFAGSETAEVKSAGLFTDGYFNSYDHTILISLIGGAIALAFINIFLFKNRNLQLLLSRITILLIFSVIVVGGILFYLNFENRQAEMEHVNVRLGLFIPFVSIALLYFANKYIIKDNKLVKSMDRLR